MALFDEDDEDDDQHGHNNHLLMLPSLFTRQDDEDDLLMDLTPQDSSWSLELLEAVTATPIEDTSQQLPYNSFPQQPISNHDYLALERLNGDQMSARVQTSGHQLIPSTTTATTTAPSGGGRRRPTSRNAARERSRVQSLRTAFLQLQNSLPAVPPNTKLSKLDVLVLATTYISHLMQILDEPNERPSDTHACLDAEAAAAESVPCDPGTGVHQHRLGEKGYLHPVRKWPMRSRLYAGAFNESQLQKTPNGRNQINPTNHLMPQEVDFAFQLS